VSSNLPLGFAAALIAGGKSSRMGRDKRVLEVDGQPLWQRQIKILQSLHPAELVISGPIDGPWKASLPLTAGEGRGEGEHCRVVPDRQPNCGPLAGIAAVLKSAQSSLVLVLAVDMPQMSVEYLRSLLDKCTATCGVVPKRGKLYEPLAAVYPQSCAAIAQAQLGSKNYSLQDFVRSCIRAGLVIESKISAEDEKLFGNLNRPTDLPTAATGPVSPTAF
jgi:molybdopterin-guanine dinucleotide biosynthesis protein A